MFDQSYGLRFDIYERVHLSEEVVGIQELEEIELVPNVQVIPLGDQATLRGNLLLSGVYRGDDPNRSTLTLEHWIPVEITLPMNRVQSLDDIAVEIENFDVDLLSTRTLNINGVLLLRGIEMIQPEPSPWISEQFTVVHQTKPQEDEEAFAPYPWRTDEVTPQAERQEAEHTDVSEQASEDILEDVSLYEREQEIERELEQEQALERELKAESEAVIPTTAEAEIQQEPFEIRPPSTETDFLTYISSLQADKESEEAQATVSEDIDRIPASQLDNNATEWQTPFYDYGLAEDSGVSAEGSSEEPYVDDRIEEEKPEKEKELKIALNSKKEPEVPEVHNVGLSTLLNSSKNIREMETRQAVEEEEQQAKKQLSGSNNDEVEWKSLFLTHEDEKRAFCKVKLCIVQREETLDTIAERYNLNPRELLLYNRMSDQTVSEGQVIYIPS